MPISGKNDILLRTDIKLLGGPLLGLKYSMEKRKSQEFLSKYQVNSAGTINMVEWEGMHNWMVFFYFEVRQ